MRTMEEKLREQGVLDAFVELGLDFTALIGAAGADPYRRHRWLVKRTSDKLIVNAVPEEADQDHLFWEEWYRDGGKVHHHVLSLWAPARHDAVFQAPAVDDEHPPLCFGKRWYVIDDADLRPWFLRR